jgi:beta-glucosidase
MGDGRRSRIGSAATGLAVLALTILVGASAADAAPAQPGSPCAGGTHPWCDTSLSPDQRARLVLAQMTQAEKLGYLATDGFNLGGHTGRNLGIPRLGVPDVDQTDASGGVRQGQATALPASVSLAASFDRGMAKRYGALVGDEAKNTGNDILLGPGVNIHRVPNNGRNFEYYGEDPELAKVIAVEYIEGLQRTGVMGSVKHFAGNNQEGVPGGPGSRYKVNAAIDERTLRELYLPAFEAAVKDAGVATVMTAYNKVNGEYMGENCPLVRDLLKGEWAFDGIALSDYFAGVYTTADSLNCGLDLENPSPVWFSPERLAGGLGSGQVSQATIDEHVQRQLRTLFKFGVFDRAPFPENGPIDTDAHSRAAREFSERGIVLLKNDRDPLPLDLATVDRIAVIGEAADDYAVGAGSSQVAPTRIVTALDGIRARAGAGATVVHDDGTDPERAARTAAAADVAIVVAATREGEGADRPCLSLASACNPQPAIDLDGPGPVYGDQDAVIARVAAAQDDTVVVVQSGTPVLMPWLDRVSAVLEAWYPGQEGGNAIARVLFGDVNPSGRLPVTFPEREADTPFAGHPERYPGIADEAVYSEGVFVGYRHFDEQGIEPLFAFGHGLSYTTFDYSGLRIRRRGDGRVDVSVRVRNTGERDGREVAQLYLGMPDPKAGVEQPPRWLRSFRRLSLQKGESERVTFRLNRRDFSYWDADADRFTVAPGCYRIMVGASSRDIREQGAVAQGDGDC